MKSESDWINELTQQGYHTLLFCDGIAMDHENERSFDEDHYFVVLDGEMEIHIPYQTFHLGPGDYTELLRATPYSTKMGQNGCRYLFARRV